MLIKAIALDEISSVLVDAAKKKNFYSIRKTVDDENRIDYEFWGMVKLVKTLTHSFDVKPFDLSEHYPTGRYFDIFLIEEIEIDGEKYTVNTLEEILSAIETHKTFVKFIEE